MAGWTNKGKTRILDVFFCNKREPTNLYLALVTDAVAPTADTNTFSELTEIAAGNGYTAGGYQLNRNDTDFDTLTENDTDDQAEILLKDISWAASGGPIPASGSGARYVVLTDDHATLGNREVLAWWDIGVSVSVGDGQNLTLQNYELRLTE